MLSLSCSRHTLPCTHTYTHTHTHTHSLTHSPTRTDGHLIGCCTQAAAPTNSNASRLARKVPNPTLRTHTPPLRSPGPSPHHHDHCEHSQGRVRAETRRHTLRCTQTHSGAHACARWRIAVWLGRSGRHRSESVGGTRWVRPRCARAMDTCGPTWRRRRQCCPLLSTAPTDCGQRCAALAQFALSGMPTAH